MFIRNALGLTEYQIEKCKLAWDVLGGEKWAAFDVSKAGSHCSLSCYSESDNVVYLGANAYPGSGTDANARLSMLACLAHELSHAQRHRRNYTRPFDLPDCLVDEAEASLNASFNPALSQVDRGDLVEEARDRLCLWLRMKQDRGVEDES